MEELEINKMDKRDTAFHNLNQKVKNFNVLLEDETGPPTELKVRRVLNQLETWEDTCE